MGKLTYNPEMILQAEFFLFSRSFRLLALNPRGRALKISAKGRKSSTAALNIIQVMPHLRLILKKDFIE
jgi:hypothetical protein